MYLYTLLIGHNACNKLSKLNKLTLQTKFQNAVTNNVVLGQKAKTQEQQNKIPNIETLVGAGNLTRDLSHPKRMRYLCTTESNESNDGSQAILQFRTNGSNLQATHLQQIYSTRVY